MGWLRFILTARTATRRGRGKDKDEDEDDSLLPRIKVKPRVVRNRPPGRGVVRSSLWISLDITPLIAKSRGYSHRSIKTAVRKGFNRSLTAVGRSYRIAVKSGSPVRTGEMKRNIRTKRKGVAISGFPKPTGVTIVDLLNLVGWASSGSGFTASNHFNRDILIFSAYGPSKGGDKLWYFQIVNFYFGMTKWAFTINRRSWLKNISILVNHELDKIR